MKRNAWTWAGWLALGAAAAFIGWRGVSAARRSAAPAGGVRGRGGPVAVETADVRLGEIRDVRVFTGSLEPRARYVLAPKIAGRLIELNVRVGDPLGPDQTVARIDDEEYVQEAARQSAALDVTRATVEQQTTALELAERERDRVRVLREKGIASEAEWDAADAEHRSRAAQLRVAEARLAEQASAVRAAGIRLAYTRIRSPAEPDGGRWFVEDRFVDAGAMLAANTPIASAVDLARLTAVIHVIERDYPNLRPGLAVEIETDAFPGRVFRGEVARLAPVLREASRQARVEIEVPNDDLRLRPGMFVRARIEFDRHASARLVPRGAVVTRDGRAGVFLVDPGNAVARFVPVTAGIADDAAVEILEPAVEGAVVTLGHHLLSDGTAIRWNGGPPRPDASPRPAAEARP